MRNFAKKNFLELGLNLLSAMLFLLGFVAIAACFWVASNNVPNTIAAASACFSGAASLVALKTVFEIQQDRIQREQPSIVVEFKFHNDASVYFVVRNTGASIARDVNIKFSVSPIDCMGNPLENKAWLQNPIDIVSGGEESDFLDMSFNLYSEGKPKNFSVTVNCKDERGKACNERVFHFDFSKKLMNLGSPKTSVDALDEIKKELRGISNEMRDTRRVLEKIVGGTACIVTEDKIIHDKKKRQEVINWHMRNRS